MDYSTITTDDLDGFSDEDLLKIASDPEAPDEFINYLLDTKAEEDDEIIEALSENKSLTDDQLARLLYISQTNIDALYNIIHQPNMGKYTIESFFEGIETYTDLKYIDSELLKELIRTGKLPYKYIRLLAGDPSYYTRMEIASLDIDEDIAELLIDKDKEYDDDYRHQAIKALIQNPNFKNFDDFLIKDIFDYDDIYLDSLLINTNPNLSSYYLYLFEIRYHGRQDMLEIIHDHPNYNPEFNIQEHGINKMDENNEFWGVKPKRDILHKYHGDLELLQRLKGHIK